MPIHEAIKMGQGMFNILQDADSSIILTQVLGKENYEAILIPSNIPTTITKLTQYFDRLFPNNKVGNLNLSIRLACNSDWDTFTENE